MQVMLFFYQVDATSETEYCDFSAIITAYETGEIVTQITITLNAISGQELTVRNLVVKECLPEASKYFFMNVWYI